MRWVRRGVWGATGKMVMMGAMGEAAGRRRVGAGAALEEREAMAGAVRPALRELAGTVSWVQQDPRAQVVKGRAHVTRAIAGRTAIPAQMEKMVPMGPLSRTTDRSCRGSSFRGRAHPV